MLGVLGFLVNLVGIVFLLFTDNEQRYNALQIVLAANVIITVVHISRTKGPRPWLLGAALFAEAQAFLFVWGPVYGGTGVILNPDWFVRYLFWLLAIGGVLELISLFRGGRRPFDVGRRREEREGRASEPSPRASSPAASPVVARRPVVLKPEEGTERHAHAEPRI